MKIPIRTCIVCRNRKEKSSLLRLVLSDGKIIPDHSGKKNCRGTYVCKNKACISRLSAKVFNHAFKTNLNIKNLTEILRIDDMDF